LATYGSDEEQLEALQNWWKENGWSLLTGVVIVLVVFFGNRYWQGSVQANAEAASALYDGIMERMAVNVNAEINDEDLAAIEENYDELRNSFPDSIYARYGAMMLASAYVSKANYDQAAAELNWVMENQELGFMQSAEPELFLITRLKLARVRLAQEQPQAALDLLSVVYPGVLAAGFAEVQGDAYTQLGQLEQARAAYQRAIGLGPENASLIELKLRGLDS